ncbi:metadherin a isoform X2 [Periophthalmus magnuspinnatus]|uniref:metadherin a isoform X2 n=1 Tax=Periophthalmus magnuspinnatus TaxID=409849 RepID=UPI0024371566|nr:metadherin a isoform X2 [Periophthalmus magnuspinnatus]
MRELTTVSRFQNMAGDIRGFALEKVEFISSRLKELLSSGEGYVRTHFGVDLGLKAEQYPPWVILFTAAAGLLMLAVSCAAVCGALLGGKKRRLVATTSQGSTELHKAPLTKNNTKSEELKRKNKKKLTEKNPSNGQPVSISQEEFQENEKLSLKTNIETVPTQVKKNKKKPKSDAKPTQQVFTAEGREQDDGAWETKVSNREKRQQRKKERGPDDSGSPGGCAVLRASAEGLGGKTTKKNKNHDSQLSKSSGKGDSSGAASTWSEEALNINAGWTDMSLKISGKMGPMDGPKWSAIPATQPWTQETQAWSGIESRMKNDLNPVSFSMLGLSTAESAANSIEQWTNQVPEDEWSGFNGMTAVDPCSDWNAPVEHWGNYEEPPAVEPRAFPLKEQQGIIKMSDDEKDSEDPSEGSSKSKKRRRKKKKTEEETASVSRMVSSALKQQELSMEASHKPSVSPVLKKPEETADPLKPTQKKKVRKET